MTISHDELVDIISRKILEKFKHIFGEVFISNVSMDFPKPDFIYVPIGIKRIRIEQLQALLSSHSVDSESVTLPVAFELKTPFVYKHEYLTGLGQTIAYNSIFPLSYLVIPDINIEGFDVASYIQSVVEINDLNIGIFMYDMQSPEEVNLLKKARITLSDPRKIKSSVQGITRSYSYWRETMPHEVYFALEFSEEIGRKKEGKIIDDVMEMLWDRILSKRFKSTKRKSSFLLNYKLFLIQNALLDADGRLTIIGRHTLTLGYRFGYDSEIFQEIITYVMLKYGGHYSLLSKIYNAQLSMDKELTSWRSWIEAIKTRLEEQNYYISKDDFRLDFPRLPYGYEKYFCGIVKREFIKGKGLIIDYPKIVEILEKGSKLFEPIETTLSY